MDHTARFELPYLAPGQMQKELFHNEALQTADMLLCPAVDAAAATTPPSNAAIGACYLLGPGATGAWAGQDGALACFTEGGWRFVAPIEGMSLIDRSSGETMVRRDGVWEAGIVRGRELRIEGLPVVRARQSPIGNPSGGAVVDSECRATVTAILAALRAHGLIG